MANNIHEKEETLEIQLRKTEVFFNTWAKFPLLGTATSAGRIGMGLIQFLGGLFCFIFLSPIHRFKTGKWDLALYSLSHIKHGIGNITVGLFEAIPFAGLIIWKLRKYCDWESFLNYPLFLKEMATLVHGADSKRGGNVYVIVCEEHEEI